MLGVVVVFWWIEWYDLVLVFVYVEFVLCGLLCVVSLCCVGC